MRLAGCLLLCMATPALAESVDQLDVGRDGARYHIELQARLDAPLADSYAVFSDFHNLPKINDAVEDVEPLPSPTPGVERWRTRVRVCVSFFCTRLKQVQDVRDTQDHDRYRLDAVVIPSMSNLRYGKAAWQLAQCGAQTCLSFSAELEPDFWVPPLLGPWLIERTMRREAHATAAGIEALAIAHHDISAP
ncbi:SRPBCC family protein [Solimonas terrae]|uniref:SRPBCC family protein n=1 Tax=Solimonas terrae TaxID=1396819 RepID=A0A6M2BVQ5_9GAMM|nr:SRPBCC family protein [Solimonas terrae]NGY06646.1 SRPBCC family protein [Solimonas terrae]